MTSRIPDELRDILTQTPELRDSCLVGGCVRDWLLGLPVKDFDVEVFGVSYEQLAAALKHWGWAELVGRAFGVVKLRTRGGLDVDFNLPRRDSKVAPGHRGFAVEYDPAISFRDAAARRDFTINAMYFDPRRAQLLDHFGGQEDLRRGILRHTSEAFVEDPLRVLRGMQFAGRFDLRPAPETLALCRKIKGTFRELAVERVGEEWTKWARKSRRPSAGLRFLAEAGWLEHFPEIESLLRTPQDPDWHPEGDVFTHTCHCLDALVRQPEWEVADPESRTVYMFAVLAHDFGKPSTTKTTLKEGRERIVSPGHEEAGGPLAAAFLERIKAPTGIRQRVIPLVTNHLAHLRTITDRSVRRLAKRLAPENIDGLGLVIRADQYGRPPHPRVEPDGLVALRAKAAVLRVRAAAPKPILMGRHLVQLGMAPGKQIGAVVAAAFEAQLDGKFSDLGHALKWLAEESRLELPKEVIKSLTTPRA